MNNTSSIESVPETAMEYFSGHAGTKSDFVSSNPVAIYVLLTIQLIGALLNVYLVSKCTVCLNFRDQILDS